MKCKACNGEGYNEIEIICTTCGGVGFKRIEPTHFIEVWTVKELGTIGNTQPMLRIPFQRSLASSKRMFHIETIAIWKIVFYPGPNPAYQLLTQNKNK